MSRHLFPLLQPHPIFLLPKVGQAYVSFVVVVVVPTPLTSSNHLFSSEVCGQATGWTELGGSTVSLAGLTKKSERSAASHSLWSNNRLLGHACGGPRNPKRGQPQCSSFCHKENDMAKSDAMSKETDTFTSRLEELQNHIVKGSRRTLAALKSISQQVTKSDSSRLQNPCS